MKTKIIKLITLVFAVLGLASMSVAPAFAATCTNICDCEGVSEQVKKAANCGGGEGDTYDLGQSLQNILNGVIAFLGTVAVIVIVVGGVQYMTASGDAGKVQKAKNTILYACIGLIICVLSFAIVNFTIGIIEGRSDAESSEEAGAGGSGSGAESSDGH